MIKDSEKEELFSLVYRLGEESEKIKTLGPEAKFKKDHSPITEADVLINNELNLFFSKTKFINVISEENIEVDYEVRKKWEYFWVVDPIDGTKEFVNQGTDYTINIALCKNDKPIFSIVYAPARKEFYSAEDGLGAKINNRKISVDTNFDKCVNIVASKSHLNAKTEKYINNISKLHKVGLLKFGSSLKICKIAEGSAHLYPRFGPTMEWDTCASDLVLREAGGIIMDLNRDKLKYNKKNLKNPFFIAQSINVGL